MVQLHKYDRIPTFIFPNACDSKKPWTYLNGIKIYMLEKTWTLLYYGISMFNTLEIELEQTIVPTIIVPESINKDTNCEQAAVNKITEVCVFAKDVHDKYILLYYGGSHVVYTDDFDRTVLEEAASDFIESDYVKADPLPELSPLVLNTIELSPSDFETIDLPSTIEHDAIDPLLSDLSIENGTVFTRAESRDECFSLSSYQDLYFDYDTGMQIDYSGSMERLETHSIVSSVSNEDPYLTQDVGKVVTKNNNWSQIIEDEYEEDDIIYEAESVEMMVEETDRNESEACLQQEGEDEALKQLMSSNIQSVTKQRKIILFSGKDSRHGQTIQKMSYIDQNYECPANVETDTKTMIDTTEEAAIRKKYQCTICQRMFNDLRAFKKHITAHGRPRYTTRNTNSKTSIEYTCQECGKKLKTKDKYETHVLGHGDPERECRVCHNVLASKFSLRAHMKTHNRKYRCNYCTKTFDKEKTLKTHTSKVHANEISEMDLPEALLDYEVLAHDNVLTDNGVLSGIEVDELMLKESENLGRKSEVAINKNKAKKVKVEKERSQKKKGEDETNAANENYIITKAVSHEMFLSKGKKHSKGRKQCNVCPKSFDRISDLKRHLIEHMLSSTLRKSPANKNGTLDIQCCLCDGHFNKIDKYKAHLREHANLTIYTCTFCDKSFSDSSNFSKHKKIHGQSSFQCDMCQRKFNSKKMLIQHMEYHNDNPPIQCCYCDKVFHFESMLKKHVKSAHTKELSHRFRCRFCHKYFKALREKWDHEWLVHNVRKMVVDCHDCGAKFRKYSELKRHCLDIHDLVIPLAKNMIKETRSTKRKFRLTYEE